ncbi:MAG: pentapeptide repeat-containing protein [Leptolyngbyaceae cyanobacterium]
MSSLEHWNLIKLENKEVWNRWREENTEVTPQLSYANLRDTNLRGFNLSRANLQEATLVDADLSHANLNGSDLSCAELRNVCLNFATLANTKLHKANLAGASCLESNFIRVDFSDAKLHNADFSNATLRESNLTNADFSSANLTNADLTRAQASKAIFCNANFTGAGICDWKISKETALSGASCDFIYLQESYQERLPTKNKDFSPGEFVQILKQDENPLRIMRGNNIVNIARLNFMNGTNRIFNVDAGSTLNYVESNDGSIVQGNYIEMSDDLVESASKIQDLLDQLQRQGMSPEMAKRQVAGDLVKQVNNDPSVKEKLVKLGHLLGTTAAQTTVSDLAKGTLKLALSTVGISLL